MGTKASCVFKEIGRIIVMDMVKSPPSSKYERKKLLRDTEKFETIKVNDRFIIFKESYFEFAGISGNFASAKLG